MSLYPYAIRFSLLILLLKPSEMAELIFFLNQFRMYCILRVKHRLIQFTELIQIQGLTGSEVSLFLEEDEPLFAVNKLYQLIVFLSPGFP